MRKAILILAAVPALAQVGKLSVIPPQGVKYWKTESTLWRTESLPIGGQTYDKAQLLALLNLSTPADVAETAAEVSNYRLDACFVMDLNCIYTTNLLDVDASVVLARQLIAAKLNVLNGADDASSIAALIAEADALLNQLVLTPSLPAYIAAGNGGDQLWVDALGLSIYNNRLATVVVSPTSLAFPVSLNFAGLTGLPVAMTVAIADEQNTDLTIKSITIAGPNAGDFTLTQTDEGGQPLLFPCAPGTLLVPPGLTESGSQYCKIGVTFAAGALGARRATLTVVDTIGTHTIPLTGTGGNVAQGSGYKLISNPVDFGNQTVGTESVAETLTIINNQSFGNMSFTFAAVGPDGQPSQDFVVSDPNYCMSNVGPWFKCEFTVLFLPSALGKRTATLQIGVGIYCLESAVIGATGVLSPCAVSAPLAGTGVAQAELSSGNLAFDGQGVGSTSAAKTITLTNNRPDWLAVTGITIDGPNSGDFLHSTTCGAPLIHGGTCDVKVQFKPSAAGARNAVLTIHEASSSPIPNTPLGPQTVTLVGN